MIYDFTIKQSNGKLIDFNDYKGKTILIVNTATKCGLAPQFKELEKLNQSHKDSGLEIIGFPCDQFLNQEPVNNEEMANTCEINFGVTFPLTEKIDVNGANTHPIFKYLKEQKGGFISNKIKWNFTKFLINKEGKVIKRFSPTTSPSKIEKTIIPIL